MYNLYIKGAFSDNDQLNNIKNDFNKNELNLNMVFYTYTELPIMTTKNLNISLDDSFRKNNPMGQQVNLICHSLGCNFGILIASRIKKIQKIILISPTFGEFSKQEIKNIHKSKIHPNFQIPYGENKTKINKEKIKSLILFNKTKHLTQIAIEKIQIPILIIYSKEDLFIPQNYIKQIAQKKENIEIFELDSSMHNPLNSKNQKQKTINLIKNYLNS